MFKKIAITIGVIIALTITACWTFIVLLEGRAEEELEAAQQRLRSMGAPMTIEAILPPPIAEEDNAAILYREATQYEEKHRNALSKAEDIIWELQEGNDDEYIEIYEMDDASLEQIREIFKTPEVIEYLSFFENTAKRPHSRRDYSSYDKNKPAEFLMPTVGTHMDGIRFLDKRSSLRFLDGERKAAVADLETMGMIVQHASEDKLLISQLTAVASAGMLLRNIALADRHSLLSNSEIDSIKDYISNIQHYDDIIESYDTERLLLSEPIIELVKSGNTTHLQHVVPDKMLQLMRIVTPLIRWHLIRDHAYYLNATTEIRKMYQQPYHKVAHKISAFEKRLKIETKEEHFLFSSVLTVMEKIRQNALISDTTVQLTMIGLSLTQYHNDHGIYPETLDQLLPDYLRELPIDPFSGNRFIYRREGDGYLLYSIGLNMFDDGGTPNHEGLADENEGDLVWKGRGSLVTE
ncbi:hypothetical protein [Rubellicoccus peritrichatus]|uniref:Type II secretion system protein GspG C-terminal domain-containing protein n=1 Tax=Rubellicoccus peritrichatus TaxID=3080537 RepID=A0AAQ3QWB5_9BACT|nr:hypothetical protein [Puniceicoccus sp. CR14]WOO41715.1 hypothetical protein RZN69_01345 [Puniceicoccus sp. CR14]